jgi:hypothetical protein
VAERLNAGWKLRPFHNNADYAETAPFRDGLSELLAAGLTGALQAESTIRTLPRLSWQPVRVLSV